MRIADHNAQFRIFGRFLSDLRTGGSRVAGDHTASGLIEPTGNGFVAQHQFLHSVLRVSVSSLATPFC